MKRIVCIFVLVTILFLSLNAGAAILNGKILAVNSKHNFVIINLGVKDKVKKGMVFMVYREKKLIGKVEAENIFSDMSSCAIMPWITKEEFKKDDGVLKP